MIWNIALPVSSHFSIFANKSNSEQYTRENEIWQVSLEKFSYKRIGCPDNKAGCKLNNDLLISFTNINIKPS